MSDRPADSDAPRLTPPPPGESWSRNKFFLLVAFALALHIVLIFVFGNKKPILPRPVTNVPHLQLADSASELIALGDPTLFARPNARDFVTAFWQRTPPITPPDFNWTENPRYLLPVPNELGAAFREFMQTNHLPEMALNFKPDPQLTEPATAFGENMPPATTLQLSGELAQRRLLTPIKPPSISVNDVIAPSVVQVLIDTAGSVHSTVLLESSTLDAADQRALQLARSLRFAPAPRLMFGEIIFNWHTVPVVSTNTP